MVTRGYPKRRKASAALVEEGDIRGSRPVEDRLDRSAALTPRRTQRTAIPPGRSR